jgi:hypothetical protein
LRQIAASSHTNIGRVLKKTKIADNLELRQVRSTVGTNNNLFYMRHAINKCGVKKIKRDATKGEK